MEKPKTKLKSRPEEEKAGKGMETNGGGVETNQIPDRIEPTTQ